MEYIPCGMLFNVCQSTGGIGEKGGHLLMKQLVDIVHYMHQTKDIIHRDIKPDNILID